uniref:Uncharacterized protein n=1 Tax=Physcomitrium patens TaxID=3218 RepID=A0A2K1JKM5_PHYPA|nr:hypothetical protein PHYPA_016951 [Physcomitrium patens]
MPPPAATAAAPLELYCTIPIIIHPLTQAPPHAWKCKCQCGSVCSLLVSSVPCRSIIRVRVSVLPCLSTSLTTQDVDLSVGFLFVAYAEASLCNFFGLLALHLHTAGCVGVVNSSMLQLLPVFCCACCIQAKGCCYQISGRA